jgi:hypothetical protein
MFPLSEDMYMPGEAFVQMNSKIFDIFCLRERFIVDVDYGTVSLRLGNMTWVDLDPFAFSRHRESQC